MSTAKFGGININNRNLSGSKYNVIDGWPAGVSFLFFDFYKA